MWLGDELTDRHRHKGKLLLWAMVYNITCFYPTRVRIANRGFPKVDHSGIDARIVLEQINSAKNKTTSNRNWTLNPRTVSTAHFLSLMPYPCARSHHLKDWDFNDPYIAMVYWFQLNPLSSSKSKKSIEHDYIRIIKVSVFQAMGSSTGVRHERQKVSSRDSPRVEGSIPVRGSFVFCWIYLL